MGLMKDFDIRIRNGGDNAVAAVNEYLKLRDRVVRLPPDEATDSPLGAGVYQYELGWNAALKECKKRLESAGVEWELDAE